MAELISDRSEAVWPSQASSKSSSPPECANLAFLEIPSIEEHLLFEQFMHWWNEHLPDIETASEFETPTMVVDEILGILLTPDFPMTATHRSERWQQCLDRLETFVGAQHHLDSCKLEPVDSSLL